MDLTWWQIVLGVVVGLILLVILIIVHELGHAWVARRNGVKVEEFGVGFPPRAKILGRQKDTLITLNWLPLGGFCKMKGESDDAKGKGTYGAASFWAKTKILFAGVTMNLITAMVIFTILALTGLPKIVPYQFALASDNHGQTGVVEVYGVVEDSPADKAGLEKGDEILALVYDCNFDNAPNQGKSSCEVEKTTIEMTSQVSEFTKEHAGKTVEIEYSRDGQESQTMAKLNEAGGSQGYLGVQTDQKEFANIKATWSAPLVGIVDTFQFIWMTLAGLGDLLVNFVTGLVGWVMQNPDASAQLSAAGDSVAGPVGILGSIFPQALVAGPTQLFWLMGIISLTLTVMNLLPIPGLDGGRWFLTALYRVRKKPLTKEKEETIVGTGMLILFALIALITIADIWKLF